MPADQVPGGRHRRRFAPAKRARPRAVARRGAKPPTVEHATRRRSTTRLPGGRRRGAAYRPRRAQRGQADRSQIETGAVGGRLYLTTVAQPAKPGGRAPQGAETVANKGVENALAFRLDIASASSAGAALCRIRPATPDAGYGRQTAYVLDDST